MTDYKDFPLEGWAWEFLRRSKPYRDSYKQYIEEQKKCTLEYVDYHPSKPAEEAESAWLLRCHDEGAFPRKLTLSAKYGLNFSLWDMYSSDEGYSSKIKFIKDFRSGPLFIENYESILDFLEIGDELDGITEISERQCVVIFDMTYNIEAQINDARIRLEHEQERRGFKIGKTYKNKNVNWLTYLKLLDAYNENPKISKTELGKLCGAQPTDSAYSNAGYKNLKRAQKLQETYLDLVRGFYPV